MKCRYCEMNATPTPTRAGNLRRFRDFMLLAAVLLLIAGATWALGVAIWPWWTGGAGAFVVSQALMKWHESRWMLCESRQHGFTHYGRLRESA